MDERRILTLVERCEEITAFLSVNQYEELGIKISPGDWVSEVYTYSKGKLEVETTYLCDGPFQLHVRWEDKIVLSVDEARGYEELLLEGEDYRTIFWYKPGPWEEEIMQIAKAIYD